LFTLLGGTPMAGGTWSPALTSGTGVFDPASDAAGVYTYTVSGTVCPNATATVTVTITASDDPTFAFADYCAGSANGPTGIVTPGGTFTFNPVPGDGATINASTGVITNGVGGNSYTIQYTTPAGPCQDSSTVNITVGVSANAGTNGNTTLCSSAAIVDLFTLLGGTPGASGTWSGPSALGGGSLGTFDPATNTAGTYDYLVTGTNGCVNDTASVTVNIDVSPGTANAGSDQTICNTVTTATLNGNIPSAGTGVWIVITGGGTVTTPASSSSGVTNLSNGTNQFVWTISNGICPSDADTVTVLLQSCTSTAIEIPTGFTPDGDGSNDTWVIPNINLYPDVRVEIFNRWGGLLFASDGYATPWDGKYEGENMPVGSYYFVIDLKDGTPAYKGTVTIIR
ncbi:MAG: gliding motility-associated C-terminal domain-containing protein, partial [Bacteroidota bacterium]